MTPVLVGVLTFVGLVGAAFASMTAYYRLAERHRSEETNATVRLVAAIFVTMTSLVLGLIITTATGTFQQIDRDLRAFSTDLLLLQRTLHVLGPPAEETRGRLAAYVRHAIGDEPLLRANPDSARLLEEVGTSLRGLQLSDPGQIALWNEARSLYRQVLQQRWTLTEQAEGMLLPPAIVAMLLAWLLLIFASLGYRAPRNRVVAVSLVVSALLVAVSMYLILDMSSPFSGPIQISDVPLRRVLEELRR